MVSQRMANILVKPSTANEPEIINLPPADQFVIRAYNSFFLCFQLDPEVSPQQVYWELRCGLSDALVEYPFMAGRVVKYDMARDRIHINLSLDDGVDFQYKDLTSSETQTPFPEFHDLERSQFSPVHFDLVPSPVKEVYPTGPEWPALLLQANFIKGGLLLAFCPHHSTTDFQGWTGFLRSWAKHTSTVAKGSKITPHRSLGIMDPSLLFKVCTDIALEDCEQLVKVDDVAGTIKWISKAMNGNLADLVQSNVLRTIWYFSPERLRALKAASQPIYRTDSDSWVSTNDALCALLWRRITIARNLKESEYETSNFRIPCNIRGQLSPKLDPEYVGNASFNASCSYFIEKLCSTDPDCQVLVASAIRKAINRIDEPMVRNFWGIVDSLPTMGSALYNFNFRPGPHFFTSTWADYDWYSLNWGNHLGRVARQRPLFPKNPGFVVIQPQCSDGGLEVFMTLEVEVLERLKHDETFTTFAELRCCS